MQVKRYEERPWVNYRRTMLEDYVAIQGASFYAKLTGKAIRKYTDDSDFQATNEQKKIVQKMRRQERSLLVTINELYKYQKTTAIPATAPARYEGTTKLVVWYTDPVSPTRYDFDHALQKIGNGINLEEVLTGGENTIVTCIPAREGDQDHIINVYTSNLLLKALRADHTGYHNLATANSGWYAKYYVWLRPLLLETMALQYQRGGYNAYELHRTICVILGLETGIPNCHLLTWDQIVFKTRESWFTEWITIFQKIEHLYPGNIDGDTTCLSFLFEDLIIPTVLALTTYQESKMLEAKVRITQDFFAPEKCRRCYGKARTAGKCEKCSTNYCSRVCRDDDFIDHAEECGVFMEDDN